MFDNPCLQKCSHSPHSIARRIMPTPRWQELGPTCLLQLIVPEPWEQHRNPKPSKRSEPITNPSKPGTPKPSKPGTTFGTRNLSELSDPNPRTCQNQPKHIETWNYFRFPEAGSFPEPPQLAQNTPKSILCKDTIAFY